MTRQFRVGLTRDFLKPDGSPAFGDIGLSRLDEAPGISWDFLPDGGREVGASAARDFDALLVLAPRVTAATVDGTERLAIVARFGVGYDSVDVEACTRNGVLLTITPDGVRRPVATSAMTFLLALSHQLLPKDRLTRSGGWARKTDLMGTGLVGRTLGLLGLGNIGREVFALARPFGLRQIAYDPFATAEAAAAIGVELVDLETLLRTADYLCICAALTPETHKILNAERLALLKPTAFLINVARGPIVDQAALTTVLRERRIAGAGLDVFEEEPVDPNDEILTFDNVIVTPHAICWTDECMLNNGRSAIESILDVAAGRTPRYIVNRAVLDHPRLKTTLDDSQAPRP